MRDRYIAVPRTDARDEWTWKDCGEEWPHVRVLLRQVYLIDTRTGELIDGWQEVKE